MVNSKLKKQALIGAATVSVVGATATVANAVDANQEPTNVEAKSVKVKKDDNSTSQNSVTKALSSIDLNNVDLPTPAQQEASSNDALVTLSNKADETKTTTTNTSNNNENTTNDSKETKTYTVVSGDSLWTIAQKFGVSVDSLISANGGKTLITVGQVLTIPTTNSAVENNTPAQSAPSSSATTSQAPVQTPSNSTVASSSAVVSAPSNSVATSKPSYSAAPSSSAVASQAPSSSSNTNSNVNNNSSLTQRIIDMAINLSKQGIPYVWGGSNLSGFDCSGFTSYVFQNASGIYLPHNTVMQEGYITKKSVSEAKPGDLLFWGNPGATYHVAIYIGNNQYVAAPKPGSNVQIQTIGAGFMPSFAGTVNALK